MGESSRDRCAMLAQLGRLEPASGEPAGQRARAHGRHAAGRRRRARSDRAGAHGRVRRGSSRRRRACGCRPDASRLSDEAQALCFVAGANSIFSGEKLLTSPNPTRRRRSAVDGPARSPISGMNPRQEFEARLAATLAVSCAARGCCGRCACRAGIDLVSNDYLGLAGHPYLTDAMRIGARRPAGRFGRFAASCAGITKIFERIEERLAAFSGTEAALLFGSGYAANIGLLQAIVSARRSHRLRRAQSREPDRRHPADEGRDRHLSASGSRRARSRAAGSRERGARSS